jgi:ribA/ribD-fused uncharacterized protein
MVIESFTGKHAFLSNFYVHPIQWGGHWWPSVEHLFQARKFTEPKHQDLIRLAKTPALAKGLGGINGVTLTHGAVLLPDWDRKRLPIMRECIDLKFAPGTNLAKKLIATGNVFLVEGNTWNDTYWGICEGVGENWLGRLLMVRRSVLDI